MKLLNSDKINGFTLSEVLITLGIIGVVAAITIPALMNNAQKKDDFAKLQKAYSTITGISSTIRNNNGGEFTGLAASHPELLNLFKPYMNVIKICQNLAESPNCYLGNTDDVYNLQGGIMGDISPYYFRGEAKLVTADGMMYNFEFLNSNCAGSNYSRNGTPENCGGVMVDINGAKPPNTVGKDIFFIQINKYNTTLPSTWPCDKSNTNAWNGVNCSQRAIKEGGIFYY